MCSSVINHDLVPSLPDNCKSQAHSRVPECDGRPSPINRMVTASAGVQTDLSKVVHSSCRSISHSSEPQSSIVCISVYIYIYKLARDPLIFGPSAALNRDPTPVTSVNNTSQTASQPSVSQQSTISQPPHLVSRSGQLQEQGFSVEVAERIAAPQRSSTRTICKSKWSLFKKWRKFSGFLHSLCVTSLRLFHAPVPRSEQAPVNH